MLSNKLRSKTQTIEALNSSKNESIAAKRSVILRIESEIRKLKEYINVEKQMNHNRQELETINQQISKYEQDLKSKRKEAVSEKLLQMQRKKMERQSRNAQSNELLKKIKQQRRQRRRKMESIVSLYKEEYENLYEIKLKQRKAAMKFNIHQIDQHEEKYMKMVPQSRSVRAKTEHAESQESRVVRLKSPFVQNNDIRGKGSSQDIKREELKQLVKKRKQYGQKVQKMALSVKIPVELLKKVKNVFQNREFEKNIDQYERAKKLTHKPKLNTNFQGDLELCQSKEIEKIARKSSPVKDKLAILQNLANGYRLRYKNGHEDALQKMSDINLKRADLLLHDI